LSICFDRHSERTSAPCCSPGREGVGGFIWDKRIGFPGTAAAANLTPTRKPASASGLTAILRAMREGVDRNGNALFPIMPYGHYKHMSDDDAKAIVAYLRTIAPRKYAEPKKALDVPLN
jgi:hypothetical protein